MPEGRRPQPSTPPDLLELPSDSDKKEYYVAGDKVYFFRMGNTSPHLVFDPRLIGPTVAKEWRTGNISDKTSSTIIAVVCLEKEPLSSDAD